MRRRPILVPSELALAFLSPCVEIRHFGVGRSLAVNCGIVPLRQCVWGNAAQTRSRVVSLLPLIMSQVDEHQAEKRDTDEATLERERASGNKLWSVYIYEAQKYDQGLIEGWRSEMDGLLIFAGLFSGVVTTFIIDSYKTLNPDSGSQTVVLLSQTVALLSEISSQLASMNNATAVADALPPPAAFSPPVSSLVCNALWFASLGLSLSSALVATLVKQWAQEYQHRTSMFSSPSVRSRVYMYLYYGLRRFNMHAVVGVPPLLLHGALLLFFAGLVAFLVPINIFIMAIISALLLLFILVYGTFTALPYFSSTARTRHHSRESSGR
ncbi:unnamed protein product [Mycena citricolor]|uniref:DUF6535 domain-containing protein n=1 Tax=Mycena citricolor TaxID=2018698 RepID=A0AAD2GW02_9AGAR|nr:unnamed protein product [Mycena citricolor]